MKLYSLGNYPVLSHISLYPILYRIFCILYRIFCFNLYCNTSVEGRRGGLGMFVLVHEKFQNPRTTFEIPGFFLFDWNPNIYVNQ